MTFPIHQLTPIPTLPAIFSRHYFTVHPPALSSPIGVKYRWDFLDDTGETVTEEVHLCVEATNETPTAVADRYVVFDEETDL